MRRVLLHCTLALGRVRVRLRVALRYIRLRLRVRHVRRHGLAAVRGHGLVRCFSRVVPAGDVGGDASSSQGRKKGVGGGGVGGGPRGSGVAGG